VFRFKPLVAPVKATVFPLVQKEVLNGPANSISTALTAAGLSNIIDTTGELS
jgi:glycyl-tRNA synthetase